MKLQIDIDPLKKRIASNIEPLRARIAAAIVGREQFFQLVRDTKWFILISMMLSVLLYVPDQISELYRFTYASVCWNWHYKWFFSEFSPCLNVGFLIASVARMIWFYLAIALIGILVWFGTHQVAAESCGRLQSRSGSVDRWIKRLPIILGVLPLLACAAGQYFAIPDALEVDPAAAAANTAIGDSAQPKAEMWADSVTAGLTLGSILTAFIGVGLGFAFPKLSRQISDARALNERWFYNRRFLGATIAFFVIVTAAFVIWPVPLPQLLTVFGILSLFTLCIVAFCLYFSLLTIEYRLPFISGLLILALIFSILDLNDNHVVRVLVPGDGNTAAAATKTAGEEFERWYERRPNLSAYEEYPVYIVAAQGGGMYAAYQTAVFLARLQDKCPAFRNHLFAISSVSGGSVGAATFASALRLADRAPGGGAIITATPAAGEMTDPCPTITSYFRSLQQRTEDNRKKKEESDEAVAEVGEDVGTLEKIVSNTLGTDLLSPLVAATLFPDFGQRFLPFPVSFFDRARALELAFESATAEYDPENRTRPFGESFLSHWKPAGSTPALLMNATDSGSGRRVLIAPFELHDRTSANQTIMHFPFYPRTDPNRKPIQLGAVLNIALSTAAGISARFPWLTPAATIDVSDGRFGSHKKLRLVDGGYVDNSGVETVLDLIDSLGPVKAKIEQNSKDKKTFGNQTPYRRVQLNVIVLSGGTYAERSSFALGETMEPIRGLLNARSSRAYIAIERAKALFPPRDVQALGRDGAAKTVSINGLRVASLRSYSYPMPLGWVLSKRSREIIEDQSGNFDDCEPNERFMQSSTKVPESDCIQLLTYHTLNKSLGAKLDDIDDIKRVQGVSGLTQKEYSKQTEAQIESNTSSVDRLDQNRMLSCYRGKGQKSLNSTQVNSLQELLKIWDRQPASADDRWLAFILGSLAYETGDFRVQVENLSYRSADRISAIWRSTFPTPESATEFVNNPEALANRIYGNRLGNNEMGDGFRYRGRGLVQLTGRADYRKYGKLVGEKLEEEPDLLLRPEIGAKVAFEQFLPGDKASQLAQFFNKEKDDWAGARNAFAGGTMGTETVTVKGKAFLQCIQEAKKKAS